MCRIALSKGKDNKLLRELAFHHLTNSWPENNDGFFLLSEGIYIRTLDVNEIYKAIPFIKGFYYLHCRQSTNVVKPEYVHGWQFRGFYCSHNGIVETKGKAVNDSLDFFKHLSFNSPYLFRRSVIKELKSRWGGGCFFVVNKKGSGWIVSVNHDLHIYYEPNTETISYLSSKDIHCENKSIDKGALRFYIKVKFNWPHTTYDKHIISLENFIPTDVEEVEIKKEYTIEGKGFYSIHVNDTGAYKDYTTTRDYCWYCGKYTTVTVYKSEFVCSECYNEYFRRDY